MNAIEWTADKISAGFKFHLLTASGPTIAVPAIGQDIPKLLKWAATAGSFKREDAMRHFDWTVSMAKNRLQAACNAGFLVREGIRTGTRYRRA